MNYFVSPENVPNVVPTIKIVRAKFGAEIRGIVLGHHPYFVWEHFDGSRTRPCDDHGFCKLCERGLSKRFSCYFYFKHEHADALRILHLPASCCPSVRDAYLADPDSWAGRRFVVTRRAPESNSKASIKWARFTSDSERFDRSTPSLKLALFRIWGISDSE